MLDVGQDIGSSDDVLIFDASVDMCSLFLDFCWAVVRRGVHFFHSALVMIVVLSPTICVALCYTMKYHRSFGEVIIWTSRSVVMFHPRSSSICYCKGRFLEVALRPQFSGQVGNFGSNVFFVSVSLVRQILAAKGGTGYFPDLLPLRTSGSICDSNVPVDGSWRVRLPAEGTFWCWLPSRKAGRKAGKRE